MEIYRVILTNVSNRFKIIKGSRACYALITLNILILLNLSSSGQSALVDQDHWVCVLAARRPQNYILPHPDCTKFHVCQYLGGTRHSAKSWKAHIFNCPATTGFDELLKVCNHLYNLKQRNGKCESTPMINVPSSSTDAPSTATTEEIIAEPTTEPSTRAPIIPIAEPPTTSHIVRVPPAKVDCIWDSWSSFSGCSSSCGAGFKIANRKRLQEAQNGGTECRGKTKKTRSCFSKPCPRKVNCKLSLWSSWTDCSTSCDTGTQSRTRQIVTEPKNGGKECDPITDQTQDCTIKPCPVDGTWSKWTEFTECSQTCIGGIQRRTRSCSKTQFGGKSCEGEAVETLNCPSPEQDNVDLSSNEEGSGEENLDLPEYDGYDEGSGSHILPQCDITVCKTTDQKTTSGNGEEYEVPDQNKECVFPFKFEAKEYSKCTNFGCPECFWCGTQYSVSNAEGWGVCDETCATQEYEDDSTALATPELPSGEDISPTITSSTTERLISEVDPGIVTTTKKVVVVTTTTTHSLTTKTSTNPTTTIDSDTTENLDVDSLIGQFNIDIRR